MIKIHKSANWKLWRSPCHISGRYSTFAKVEGKTLDESRCLSSDCLSHAPFCSLLSFSKEQQVNTCTSKHWAANTRLASGDSGRYWSPTWRHLDTWNLSGFENTALNPNLHAWHDWWKDHVSFLWDSFHETSPTEVVGDIWKWGRPPPVFTI